MAVVLETSLGDITLDLYTDERPRCCLNFLKLCKLKYYNYCLFHSVQRNLVAQTGDPSGTGRRGASIFEKLYGEQAKFFDCELKPRIKHTKMGCVSMVNNGNNMHGSQFFLTLAPGIDYLDRVHTVFGEVAEGFDVIKKLNEAFVDKEHRPFQDIRIYHTVVLDDPFDDPPELKDFIPDRSPEPTQEQLGSVRIGADEKIDDTGGKSKEEIKVMLDDKEATANAQILEMVGDIPDAEIKPEDNILFVCKLNPVTTDDDLEIIFSRFGSIKSCEIIKDHKTKESLQYAFIEFEKAENCESAYFKMDNVLIDDRRIHVDFSQSVAKVKWKGYRGNKLPEQHKGTSDGRTEYIVKDRSKKTQYNMVFDDEPAEDTSERKGKHKKKKHRKRSESKSESSSDESERKKQTEKRRQRSKSPIHHRDKRYERTDDRQGSRHRTDERNRVTQRSERNYRERSRTPDKYREKHRDHEGHRDKRSEKEHRDKKKRRRHSSDSE